LIDNAIFLTMGVYTEYHALCAFGAATKAQLTDFDTLILEMDNSSLGIVAVIFEPKQKLTPAFALSDQCLSQPWNAFDPGCLQLIAIDIQGKEPATIRTELNTDITAVPNRVAQFFLVGWGLGISIG
jgi:hypothetical protein